jgi:predicted nicotinamide N-methyase
MHRPGVGANIAEVNNAAVNNTGVNNDRAAFIAANTEIQSPRLLPEIRLHLASENMAIWQMNDEQREAAGVPLPYWAFAWAGGQALARYMLDHPTAVAGRRLLDIGAGSGLMVTSDDLIGQTGDWDVVMVGDLFFEQPLAKHLEAWLRGLHGDGREILIGDPQRTYLPRGGLEKLATYAVPTTAALEDSDLRNASVWRMVDR